MNQGSDNATGHIGRNSEFKMGKWDLVEIKNIASINEKALSAKTASDFEFTYLDLSCIDKGRISWPKMKVQFGTAPSRAQRVVRKNDIMMAMVRPNLQAFAFIENEPMNVVCSTGFALLSPNKNVVPKYLYQILYSSIVTQQIESLITGSNYPAMNSEEVGKIKIPFPPLPEQRKIAEILSCWDRAIENINNNVQKLKSVKKTLQSSLVSGCLRFSQFSFKWKEYHLKDFLISTSYPVSKPSKSYTALSIRCHGKGTFTRQVDDPLSVDMETLFQVRKGELIVNITFAWEGAIAIVKETDVGAFVSHRFPTFKFNENIINPDFFSQVILTKRFVKLLGDVSPGGAGRNRVLNKKSFLELKWILPSIDEQKHIALMLKNAEKEILLSENLLGQIKKQKTGLLSGLLSGKTSR